jgi:pimeloyl-ACP methyl ester carboxylesterase
MLSGFGLQRVHREGDRTPLVFLPGLFLAGRLWDGVIARCAKFRRPAFLCERSFIAWVPNAMSLAQVADELCEELDAASIERAVVVGGSFGGLLALELAIRGPARVEQLVLSGVPGFGNDLKPGTTHGGLTRRVAFAVAEQLFFDRSRISNELVDASLHEVRNPVRLSRLVHLLRVAKRYDTANALARVQRPAALIWGERDTITPLGRWADEARRCDWPVTTISRTGHAPMLERPEAFSDALAEVLA